VVGRSPYQYLLNLRLQHVAHRLINSADTITHIALSCGFGDLSTFVSHFRRQFRECPSRFRTRYRRTHLGWCPLYYRPDPIFHRLLFESRQPRTRRIFFVIGGTLIGFVDRREARDVVWKRVDDAK